MPFELDPAPIPGTLPQAIDHNENQFRKLVYTIENIEAVVDELRRLRVLGGIASVWAWDDTSTAAGDPGAGFVRGNAVNLNSVSALYVSKVDAYGRAAVLEDAWVANTPMFADSRAQSHYIYGTVTAISDFPTYQAWTIGTPTGSGNPSQNDPFELRFYLPDAAVINL